MSKPEVQSRYEKVDRQTQKESYLLNSYYVLDSRFIPSDTYYSKILVSALKA